MVEKMRSKMGWGWGLGLGGDGGRDTCLKLLRCEIQIVGNKAKQLPLFLVSQLGFQIKPLTRNKCSTAPRGVCLITSLRMVDYF